MVVCIISKLEYVGRVVCLFLSSVAVFGGVDKSGQIRALQAKSQVVVGTPGRIKDLVEGDALDLSGVEYLVLDEADRMLDKGFENDIRSIIGYTSAAAERQTLMCKSRTLSLYGLCVEINISQSVLPGQMQCGGLLHRSRKIQFA